MLSCSLFAALRVAAPGRIVGEDAYPQPGKLPTFAPFPLFFLAGGQAEKDETVVEAVVVSDRKSVV